MEEHIVTKHAKWRMKQRKIPDSLIQETIAKGKRAFLADRNAYEYRLNNVLGFRGHHLVVITSLQGEVITSYLDSVEKSKQYRQKQKKEH